MEEKKEGEKGQVNPSVPGVNGTQEEIFAKMADYSDKWYTNVSEALSALRRGDAKVLVFNLEKPTRYLYVTLNSANHNYFYVKEFSEDQVFKGDYNVELQKMTEEQVINLLSR